MIADVELLGPDDLADRWKPPGVSPRARLIWVQRRVRVLGLRPTIPGSGRNVRYSLASVLAAEEKARGTRRWP
jgi:hypothetical protein